MEKEKTIIYSYTDSGDFVHCNNCNNTMLLPTGADRCPLCHYEEWIAWVNEDQTEVTYSELEESGKYNIERRGKLEPSEYLSVKVLVAEFGSTDKKSNNPTANTREIIDNSRTFSGSEEEILSIIENNRQLENYEREKYKAERGKLFFQFESIEDILRDFDEWKEQLDLDVDKIIDANFWSAL